MDSETEALEAKKVRLRQNGDLFLRADGKDTIVAHFDSKTGNLEFVSKDASTKYYNQVVARLGTVNQGKDVSNLTIRSVTIKGDAPINLKNAPKRPKLGVEGDAAYDFVKWCLDYAPAEFNARYGPYLDDKGNYVRKAAHRIVEYTVDRRNSHEASQLEAVPDGLGPSSKVKAFVTREREMLQNERAIIARRGTHQGPNGESPITFTPQEVIGGWTPDDEYEPQTLEAETEA